jgi:hypothetical protein
MLSQFSPRVLLRAQRRVLAGILLVTSVAAPVHADVAVTAEPFATNPFFLAPGRTGGWQFAVAAPLHITDLGLYDQNGDGFEIEYEIGVWDGKGELLTTALLPAGTIGALFDGFRYAGIESSIVLNPGETYTIGYFAATIAPADTMISSGGSHTMHPLVQQVGGAVVSLSPGTQLTMPDSPFQGFDVWLGPGFQFNVVPGPAGLAILAMAAALRSRRRR